MDHFNYCKKGPGKDIFKTSRNCTGIILSCFILLVSLTAFGQKGGNGKDIVVRACTQPIGNGLFRVNFGYDNPNKQNISLSQDNSFIVRGSNKGKSGALKDFKSGSVDKAFSLEFNSRETVEWTVINPSGRTYTVTASANSSICPNSDILFPVYGQENGKSGTIIGLDLTALAEGNAGDVPSEIIYQINEQRVLIEVVPKNGRLPELTNLLQNTFGLSYSSDPLVSDFVIDPSSITSAVDVFFPINRLLELNTYTDIINFARPLYKTITASGVTATQGDGAQKTDLVRESFRIGTANGTAFVDGAGVKIGVISDSYDKQPSTGQSRATTDVINGDLPGAGNIDFPVPVQVLKDYPYGVSSDEGRAMLQIIHDVAPAAELAFNTGVVSPRDFELALSNLREAGCDVIVDDITFIAEPMFGESKISQAIKEFSNQPGKAHFTSAGNFANDGYQASFRSSSSVPSTNFISPSSNTVAHVFGTDASGRPDLFQAFSVTPGIFMIVLQWNESMASQQTNQGATTDLDIYIVDAAGNLLVGNNRFNVNGDPTELLVFESTGTGQANILITSANGTPPPGLAMRYVAYKSQGLNFLEYGGAPTVTGHAMTPEAFTIGAIDYRNANSPQPQAFSSYAGNLPNGALLQIDIANPDGGNTNVSSVGQDIAADEDNFPNFFGTSAAAPHAAGAFALMMSAVPSWYPQGLPDAGSSTFANQLFNIFRTTAIPAGAVERAGAGLMDSEAAFKSIANQTPLLESIEIPDGIIPGTEPFTATISGKYFPENPVVKLNGEPLEVISSSSTEIQVAVGEFTGNPELVVSSPSKTPGGTDGGDSNPLFFLDENRIFLSITADDVSAEFGQSFTYSYSLEGLPEGATLESLGLPEVVFSSAALLPYPDVNSYSVMPAFANELTEEQAAIYQVNFVEGLLNITKKDLLVQPKDATFTYGEPILIETDYIYDETGNEENQGFLSLLNQSYKSTYYSQNTLALANKIRGIINEVDILALLNQGSWMTSDHVIQNKFRAILNEMYVIDLEPENFLDYAEASSDGIPNYFRGVINKARGIINGEDLINNNVEISFENKIFPLLNSSTLGGEDDANSYASIFAIIDEGPDPDSSQEIVVTEFYSLNLITGLNVTPTLDDQHFIYPGAFLAPIASNFNITYGSGRLNILPATLHVETQDMVIYQGENLQPNPSNLIINGFAYDETQEIAFPEGISFYYVNENGDEYQNGDTGVFSVRIREPENYSIEYDVEGKLYVNPSGTGVKKVRAYLSCVEFNKKGPGGLKYTAHFRYENPNSVPIYVLPGPDNLIVADGNYEGVPPTVFLPGQGEFPIRFDGKYLKWELTTFDSTNKASTSTDASSSSGRCGPSTATQDITAESFVMYPNPVSSSLFIQANISASVNLEIFNSSGSLFHIRQFESKISEIYEIDMSSYPPGTYILRLATYDDVGIYNILKN